MHDKKVSRKVRRTVAFLLVLVMAMGLVSSVTAESGVEPGPVVVSSSAEPAETLPEAPVATVTSLVLLPGAVDATVSDSAPWVIRLAAGLTFADLDNDKIGVETEPTEAAKGATVGGIGATRFINILAGDGWSALTMPITIITSAQAAVVDEVEDRLDDIVSLIEDVIEVLADLPGDVDSLSALIDHDEDKAHELIREVMFEVSVGTRVVTEENAGFLADLYLAQAALQEALETGEDVEDALAELEKANQAFEANSFVLELGNVTVTPGPLGMADVSGALQLFAAGSEPLPGLSLNAADVRGVGSVRMQDVSAILQWFAAQGSQVQ